MTNLKNRDIQRLILLNTAVIVAYEVCLTVLNLILQKFYAGAVGLSGLQTRAMLDTVQTVLQELGVFLLPFWQIAVIRVAICKQRQQTLRGDMLTFGFQRLGPVLGVNIMLSLVLVAVAVTVVQMASLIYSFTQKGQEFALYVAAQIPENGDIFTAMEQLPVQELLPRLIPVLVLAAVLGVPAVYFAWCRFRLASYLVMDDEKVRAVPAMIQSLVLTRKQTGRWLQLDLRLWWYYLAQGVAFSLGFLDLLLPLVGVKVDTTVLLVVALCVGGIARLAVAWHLRHRAELTYAGFYEELTKNNEPLTKEN